MKYKVILSIAVLLLAASLLVSCGKKEGSTVTTAAQTTAVPLDKFVDPSYPLMDLLSEDLTKYVKIPELSTLNIEYNVYVDDEDLDDEISDLAMKNGYYVAADSRTTKQSDTLCVKYVGTIDGKEFTGGKADKAFIPLIENNGYVEGFADDLYGIVPGTTVSTTVKFPDNYGVKELNGKEAVFEITLIAIVEKFSFTDETIADYSAGTYTSFADFREEYRKKLIIDNLNKYESEIYEITVGELEKASTVIDLPKAHVDSYFHIYYNDELSYYESYKEQFQSSYNISSFEAYRRFYDLTDETLTAMAEVSAAEDMIMVSAAKAMGLEFTNEEYDAFIAELAKDWGFSSKEVFINYYGMDYLKLSVLKDQTVKSIINFVDVKTDYDEYKHLLEDADKE